MPDLSPDNYTGTSKNWMIIYGLSSILFLCFACSNSSISQYQVENQITDVWQGTAKTYQENVGDTWDPAWAGDDNLYSASDDGTGWHGTSNSNVTFSRISGDDFLNLNGETVNPMIETGVWGAGNGPDGRTWKSSGCISVDGSLYLVIGRHMYGDVSKDPFRRQTAINTSIIKSKDHGLTWTPSFRECYEHPMFQGNRFSTPYFFYYGKDGAAPSVDNADKYIYAVSNNGFWNNGDQYFLGRVLRSNIGNLNASDWQFYTGGDGLRDECWSSDSKEAIAMIDNPQRCGMTGATYLPSVNRYILIAWYYPHDMNVESNETRFIYYDSPHPWGPWTPVHEEINRPAGWYSPRVLSKWQNFKDGEIEAVIATAGDFWEIPWFYKFTIIPVKFKTNEKFPPRPAHPLVKTVSCTVTGEDINYFKYSGSWKYIIRDKDLETGEYRSGTTGDSFTIAFNGSRIRWYSCKGNAVGIITISIDGKIAQTLDLWTRWCPEILYNRLAFDSGKLNPGQHTFTVTVTGRKNEQSIACDIYNEKVEIEK